MPVTVGTSFLEAARQDAPWRMRERVERLTPGTAPGINQIKGRDLSELFLLARGPIEHVRRFVDLALSLVGSGLGPRDVVALYGRRWTAIFRRHRD